MSGIESARRMDKMPVLQVLQAPDCVCGQLERRKTAFDVAKLSVMSRILTHMEIHGHVVGGTSGGNGLLASRIARRSFAAHDA